MKQLLQHLSDGRSELAEVAAPAVGRGELLLSTSTTLISAGTERMLVDFGKAGWLGKARQQPDKVRMVLDKAKTDGVVAMVDAVRAKLDQPIPLGYCHVGRVVEVGPGVDGFELGQRVASNGHHAEMAAVSANLAVAIPDGVSDEAAAFTVPGAIALQGIRLAAPTLGENVVVIGLGLIGLLSVQLLRLQGCRVLGIDRDPSRTDLAETLGAETVLVPQHDPLAAADRLSRGRGVDAVLITAATQSNEPVRQAAAMCRKRGRIVLVGVTGLELSRADFYEKELTFQVSCSYGPGRYDPAYELEGQDYPLGFVRWTAKRNFEAVLDMLADGRLDVAPVISHRFAFDKAADAYALITGGESSLGVILTYEENAAKTTRRTVRFASMVGIGKATMAVIGAGGHAVRTLLPAFKAAGAGMSAVVTRSGVSGHYAAKKFGFDRSSTEISAVLDDATIDSVAISTRHDSHADLVCRSLAAGKHVFVEKPLCLTIDELDRIKEQAAANPDRLLMVGFNRRFAPQIEAMVQAARGISRSKSLVITVNAGALPADHWTVNAREGGGRIVGEACHFIDLARHLAGAPIAEAHLLRSGDDPDNALIQLSFKDGSIATIHYLTGGHRGFPKERIELMGGGKVVALDNFRKLTGFGVQGLRPARLWRQDKGHRSCAKSFVEAVRQGGAPSIPREELFEIAEASIRLATDGSYRT